MPTKLESTATDTNRTDSEWQAQVESGVHYSKFSIAMWYVAQIASAASFIPSVSFKDGSANKDTPIVLPKCAGTLTKTTSEIPRNFMGDAKAKTSQVFLDNGPNYIPVRSIRKNQLAQQPPFSD